MGVTLGLQVTWRAEPLSVPAAALWHVFPAAASNRPALYRLHVRLLLAARHQHEGQQGQQGQQGQGQGQGELGGQLLDSVNVTLGVRNATFSADSGFWLNGKGGTWPCERVEQIALWVVSTPLLTCSLLRVL